MPGSPVSQKFKRLAPEVQKRYEGQVASVSGDAVKSNLTGKVNERLTTVIRNQ